MTACYTRISLLMVLLFGLCAVSAAPAAEALTLKAAVVRALANDANVKDAELALETARASLTYAETYTPTMSLSSRYSASKSEGLDPQSAISGTDYTSESYSTSFTFPLRGGRSFGLGVSGSESTTNSSLRTGGGMSYTYGYASIGASLSSPIPLLRDERVLTEGARWSAEIGLESAQMNLEDTRRNVVKNALFYFYGALRATRDADIAQASLDEAETLLRITREKLKLGRIPEIDLIEAQINTENARAAALSGEARAQSALDDLKDYLALPLDAPLTLSHLDPEVFSHEALDEETLLDLAMRQRADVLQQDLGIQSQGISVRQAEANAKPGLSLSASYYRSGEGPSLVDSFDRFKNPSWGVSVYTTVSLDRKEDRTAIEQARLHLENLEKNRALKAQAVRLEIRSLLRSLANAARNAALLAKTVDKAAESLKIRQVEYEYGRVKPLDVTNAERALAQTRLNYSSALIDYQLNLANLRLAVGEMPFAIDSANENIALHDYTIVVGQKINASPSGK